MEVNLKEMLESGVHFGHKTDKWNPKMSPFIYTQRNGVHIFDLVKTKEKLEEAGEYAKGLAKSGGVILFVGTKNQTKEVIKAAAERAGMPYLVDRWPGGMLTNFHTILGRLKYMKEAEEKTETASGMTKKEILNLKRELEKLNSVFEGVKELREVPNALFIADIVKEKTAVREAKRLGLPIIGIADTNALPDIEYVIPGNDDAVRAVKYIADYIADIIATNKQKVVTEMIEEKEETQKETKSEEGKEEKKKDDDKKKDKDEEKPEPKDESEEKLEKLEMTADEAVVVKKTKRTE